MTVMQDLHSSTIVVNISMASFADESNPTCFKARAMARRSPARAISSWVMEGAIFNACSCSTAESMSPSTLRCLLAGSSSSVGSAVRFRASDDIVMDLYR